MTSKRLFSKITVITKVLLISVLKSNYIKLFIKKELALTASKEELIDVLALIGKKSLQLRTLLV